MIKIKRINEFKIGQNVYGFYQSIFKEKKISKNGDYYIDLMLRDSTGQINGKIWKFSNFYDSSFSEGDLVAVKGEIKRYRQKLFLEIANISLLNFDRYKKYGFSNDDIYPSIDESTNLILKKIKKDINTLESPFKDLLIKIYDYYSDEIKTYPDDLFSNRYNKKGSLILKIYNALKISKSMYKNNILIDKDIIFSGILLKYIGRIIQYDYNVVFSLSEIGKSENCFILSRDIIKKFSNKKNFPSKLINELIDIILYQYEHKKVSDQDYKAHIVYTVFELEKSFSIALSK